MISRKDAKSQRNENEIAEIIVNCRYKIHKTLGPGLFESVYEEVLLYELRKHGLKCERQIEIPIMYENITFSKSVEDSLLRIQIEQEEQYNLSTSEYEENNKGSKIINQHFFTPLKGVVTSKFNPVDNHFGTDIVAESNTIVSAVLDGTVVMAGWTLETGYIIEIQHANNIISVYKHNAKLLKDIGTVVRAGETISIIGNSGELYTSGPHLHFELWHNGTPIDPEQYIIF